MSDLDTIKAVFDGKLELITQRLDAQEERQKDNHTQNRRDIHAFRGWMQSMTDHLHGLDLKMVRLGIYVSICGAAGGAIAAIVSQYIGHLWKS